MVEVAGEVAATLYRLDFPNGRVYIGATTQTLKYRLQIHFQDARAGSLAPVHAAIRKFGKRSVSISALVIGPESYIYELEREAIRVLAPNGYNVSRGGWGNSKRVSANRFDLASDWKQRSGGGW